MSILEETRLRALHGSSWEDLRHAPCYNSTGVTCHSCSSTRAGHACARARPCHLLLLLQKLPTGFRLDHSNANGLLRDRSKAGHHYQCFCCLVNVRYVRICLLSSLCLAQTHALLVFELSCVCFRHQGLAMATGRGAGSAREGTLQTLFSSS